jgi:hypothetical protein
MAYGKIEGFNERISACALLWRNASERNADKAADIAKARNVSEDEAARLYIVGALKCAVRRGSAKNFTDALETLEAEQVSDRKASVKGIGSSVTRDVARLEKMTGKDFVRIAKDGKREEVKVEVKPEARVHARNLGKVLGALYVECDARAAMDAPDYIFERAEYDAIALDIGGAIGAYISDYVARLSTTGKKAIRDIVAASASVDAIMVGKGELAKLRERAKYLHRNFPQAEAITTRELVTLLRQYAA